MKKWLRITLFVLLGIVVLIGGVAGFGYYTYLGKYPVNKEKFPHHVGFLPASNADYHDGFTRCDPERKPEGYYHSARDIAFKVSKGQFKKAVALSFDNRGCQDTGYFNVRFIIDCNGNIGDYEINQLDNDFRKTQFEPEMVEGLKKILFQKKYWKGMAEKDLYMYLLVKLDNGEILEILP